MKRPLLLLAAFALLVPTARLHADESPETQLQFVRKLRARGYPDLALQYLEKLAKTAPGMANLLPMELARTRVALAKQKEPSQRPALFVQARKDLTDFLAKNGSSAEAPRARVELARLAAYEGQALLSQAIRLQDDDQPAAEQAARRAEKYFIQAGAELETAAKGVKDPQQQLEVRFEQGKNFLDQAATHPLNITRAKLVGKAKDALEAVEKAALSDNKNPALHLTRAWLVKCYQEGDQPDKAASYVKGIMKETVSESTPGQRWAWNFRIRFLLQDKQLTYGIVPKFTAKGYFSHIEFTPLKGSKLDNEQKLKLIQREAKDWLRLFSASHNTPEGFGVRFALAKAYLNEAQLVGKNNPKALKAIPLYKLAQAQLASLAATDNDYAEKAAQLELGIRFQQMGEKTAVAKLTNFDDCYLKARYEMFKLQEASAKMAKGGKVPEEERKEHLNNAVAAFQRGLRLANEKTPIAQQNEALYSLAYIYQRAGDPYRAAIVGEYLARAKPPTKRSAPAAALALQAYETIAAATKQATDRQRLHDLSRYILEEMKVAWANEPVTQTARAFVAQGYISEKKWHAALDLLEQLNPDDPAGLYRQAQYIQVAAAARKAATTAKEKADYANRIRKGLQKLPPLPDTADPATSQMYLSALVQVQANDLIAEAFDLAVKGQTPLAAKKYAELDALAARLQPLLAKHGRSFPEEAQDGFAAAVRTIKNRARYGLAQAEYRAGNYDAVLAPNATGAVVDEVRKLGGGGKAPIKMKDYREVGEILGLALRADVQKGKINEARGILDLLRRLSGDDEQAGASAGNVLRTLIQELRIQLREYRDKKDMKRLDETVKNFAAFLGELSKEAGGKTSPQQILFLAGCYSSLDRHADAAKLYAQIPEPKIDPKKKKFSAEEEKELQEYWFMQVNYGRSLRLAKQFPEARKVLVRILTEPHARGKFLAAKEEVHLLEDQGLYGSAVTGWSKLSQHPQMRQALSRLKGADNDERKRTNELFYDTGYHYAYCMYMYGKNNKAPATQAKWIGKGAQEFVRLMANPDAREFVGAKITELLRTEPLLAAEYGKQKSRTPAGK